MLRPAGEKEGLILYQKINFSYDKNGNKTKEVRHGGYWNEEGYTYDYAGNITGTTDANGGVITYKEPADEGGAMGIFRKILTGFCIRGSSMIRRWGSIYLRARYYNPVVVGRFTQEDVYRGDGLNLYAYCHNNPVLYYDPSGFGGEDNCGGEDKTEDVNDEGKGNDADGTDPRVAQAKEAQ